MEPGPARPRQRPVGLETLDEAGRLVLRLADGTAQVITAGEVFPIAMAAPARAATTNRQT